MLHDDGKEGEEIKKTPFWNLLHLAVKSKWLLQWRHHICMSGSGTRDSNADQSEVITRVNLLITQQHVVVSVAGVSEALESGGVAQAQGSRSAELAGWWGPGSGLVVWSETENRLSRGFKTWEQVQLRLAFSLYDWFNDPAGSERLAWIMRVCWLPVDELQVCRPPVASRKKEGREGESTTQRQTQNQNTPSTQKGSKRRQDLTSLVLGGLFSFFPFTVKNWASGLERLSTPNWGCADRWLW